MIIQLEIKLFFRHCCLKLFNFNQYNNNIYLVFRYADEVSIDDEVLVQGNNEWIPSKVTNISSSVMEGDSFLHYPSWQPLVFQLFSSEIKRIHNNYKLFEHLYYHVFLFTFLRCLHPCDNGW